MAIKVFADAGSNLFRDFLKKKKYDITVVPMKLLIKDQQFICYTEDFDMEKVAKLFYEELSGNNDIHTSLINPHDFYEAFQKEIKQGHQIICYTMAKGISGTYQSACLAASMINDELKKEMIYVIDSATAGFGEGIQAIHAFELANKGHSFEQLKQELEAFKFKVRSEFTVDDIRFLVKTGRVSRVTATLAKTLNIKPLLIGSYESTIVASGKVFGRRLAIKRLVKQCEEYICNSDHQTVYITHCNALKDAENMKKELNDNGIKNVEIYDYDLVTGSHLGPKAMAIFYIGEDRKFNSKQLFKRHKNKESET